MVISNQQCKCLGQALSIAFFLCLNFRYDPESDVWNTVAPMQLPRGGVGVAGLGGYLYAVGGNDGRASLHSVERYNPHTDKWIEVASMNRKRAGIVCEHLV